MGGITYDREGTAAERGTLGTPVEGVHLTLLDEGDEASESGVVQVESPAAALGYYPDSDPATWGAGDSSLLIWADLSAPSSSYWDASTTLSTFVARRSTRGRSRYVLEAREIVDKAIVMGLPSPKMDPAT